MLQRMGRPVRKSLQEYGRGVAGGLMFSLPLLYTMEVWWAGFLIDSRILIAYVLVTFALLLGYNRFGGMRPGVRLIDVVIDSVEEMGLGLLLSALVLFLLGRITPGMPRYEILGKIVVESMLVSVGVSVGTAQLGTSSEEADREDNANGSGSEGNSEGDSEGKSKKKSRKKHSSGERPHVLSPLVLGFCGAILFAANIAPTEEVVVIATGLPTWKVIAVAVASLAVGALILHYSEFHGTPQNASPQGSIVMISQTAVCYALALLASALMLWFFRRFDGISWATAVSETVVLAFAGTLGASAGRLLIQ